MKYIIDEDELIEKYKDDLALTFAKRVIADFLKSKKPVEKIFNGELIVQGDYYPIENIKFWEAIKKLFATKKYIGKSIKIYIEEKE